MRKRHGTRLTVGVERAMALPDGLLSDRFHLELNSDHAIVQGCRGVLAYEPNEIRLKTTDGAVRFIGLEMRLTTLAAGYTEVTGHIVTVEMGDGVDGT